MMGRRLAAPELGDSMDLPTERPSCDREQLGAVYTPPDLATWVADLLNHYSQSPLRTVLDPACGEGALLQAVGHRIEHARRLIGVDLSELAAKRSSTVLGSKGNTHVGDALDLDRHDLAQVDAVIMNPPWGATLSWSRKRLIAAGYQVAVGQYDSWDIFVEWAVKSLRHGALVAAILPDSIFLPEHRATRRLLLERTTIKLVARIGEGWFERVSRGAVVLVFRVGWEQGNLVETIQLRPGAHRRVLGGLTTLKDESKPTQSQVPQQHWEDDATSQFALISGVADSGHIAAISSQGGDWVSWFENGRGVEIGKQGMLLRCPVCNLHRPPSQRPDVMCGRCGQSADWAEISAVSELRDSAAYPWAPLIVGADVSRYRVAPSRMLRLDLDGVCYKNLATYKSPKLLVRKTGLGINAAIDYSGSLTNQVVYHYRPTAHAPKFALHYVQAVLCSQVVLAVHLARSGENQWRSHPYITPAVLSTLPVPVPHFASDEWRRAEVIADVAAKIPKLNGGARARQMARIEDLIADQFRLSFAARRWVYAVLMKTQNLQAFSHLRETMDARPKECTA